MKHPTLIPEGPLLWFLRFLLQNAVDFSHAPCLGEATLARGPGRGIRRFLHVAIKKFRKLPHPLVHHVLEKRFEQSADMFLVRGGMGVSVQVGGRVRSQQPRPYRALVIGGVTFVLISPIDATIVRVVLRQGPQSERSQ